MRKGVFWLILVFLLCVVLEACSWFALFLLEKTHAVAFSPAPASTFSDKQKASIYAFITGRTKYVAYSSALGWTIKKNGRVSIYQANSQGIRASRDYSLIPPEGIVRISTFGDSYTHCDDVKNEDTWQAQMEMANDGVEVLNFGVPAYGLDQALLRYWKEGVQYNSHIVLIGFMSENINRTVNVFRPFYIPSPFWPFSKPRFIVKDNKLLLLRNPMYEPAKYYGLLENPDVVLPALGANDFHFNFPTRYKQGPFDFLPSIRLAKMAGHECMQFRRKNSAIIRDGYYNRESEAYKVTTKLFDEFIELVAGNESLPVIILFPSQYDVAQYRKNKKKVYAPLLEYFENRGYRYLDVIPVLDAYGTDLETEDLISTLFLQDLSLHRSFHYSPLGNKIIAKYILDYLQKVGLTNAGSIEQRGKSQRKTSS